MSAAGITVNGREIAFGDIAPHTTALEWLRTQGFTGCKEGCGEGECGACSVLVARPGLDCPTEWVAVNACLLPALGLDGQEVVTAEGLGGPDSLHPVQYEMAVRGGSQCGYCTPGFVCSMAAEFYRDGRQAGPDGAPADHEHGPNGFDLHALSGNLCRCTGYRPIRDAAYALGAPERDDPLAERRQAPPTPARPTSVRGDDGEFLRPAALADALRLLRDRPTATVVAGSTDWGVEVNLRGARAECVIAIDRVPELRELTVGADHIEIGAGLTLTEIERRLAGRIPLLDQVFPQFASRLIRNGATIGGNLGTGSPIGDAAPALLALDAELVLADADGERLVPLADYFTGYRTSVRRADELIRAVRIPLPQAGLVAFHKIAKRRFDDISSVAVGFALDIADGTVVRARVGLGGVAATPIRARGTEAELEGRAWSEQTAAAAARVLRGEGSPLDDHRASAAYRAAMLEQSLLKLYAEAGS
ncbi:xanthine dehydrogenase small subunit [Amorphoplanes digitatis]|uniref:Xanthine dehydrogenase small subunit n=1 Tax=Actinoplanes digitatis TaxID=1868 RepID=A0A7W7I0N4_9ACTN|nr:FAD binding domain-containing protein [Actinoplanes digitatis]MBB4764278.1 xanthine dehydrogenase small subunit [Actinoplanes digitatis]BFE73669.1 FAD binding domain-containing protein [Actinoplanes digitatis]GID96330.1 dehydrogenase [Actinoplanes digitatis]